MSRVKVPAQKQQSPEGAAAAWAKLLLSTYACCSDLFVLKLFDSSVCQPTHLNLLLLYTNLNVSIS